MPAIKPSVIVQFFSPRRFEFSFGSRWRASVFLLAIGLPGLLVAAQTIRIALAATLGESTAPADLRRALAHDPANPRLHQRLGLLHSYSIEDRDPAEGVKHFRRATELNPHGAGYWLDLAKACLSMGDTASADTALNRALELSPMSPRTRWTAANHYYQTDRLEAAWPQFRRFLELSPAYAPATFQLCLRASGDPQLIFEKVVPSGSNPRLKLMYVGFLSAHGQIDFAYRVWVQTVANAPPFPFAWARSYLDRLLALGRDHEAVGMWKDLERLGIVTLPSTEEADNLVFNGNFERPPLKAGFDWRSRAFPFLEFDFQDATAYQGTGCLRLDFTVKNNAEREALYQIVPVASNQTYLLKAYVRSENITSDSGPRLRVLDPACPGCLSVSSETTVGTTSWHPVSLNFSTGPQTRLVRLSVWRARSRTFPTEITGSFWLDAVSVKAASGTSEKGALTPAP